MSTTIITGKPGTGKSFRMRSIISNRTQGEVLVLGPTAISIIQYLDMGPNVRAMTMDMFCCAQPKLPKCSMLVIEEFSMISCQLFARVNDSLQVATGRIGRVLGGIKDVFAVGDPYQLPPVQGECVLRSDIWQTVFSPLGTKIIETCEGHRFEDNKEYSLKCIEALRTLQFGPRHATAQTLEQVHETFGTEYTVITTTHNKAEEHTKRMLAKYSSPKIYGGLNGPGRKEAVSLKSVALAEGMPVRVTRNVYETSSQRQRRLKLVHNVMGKVLRTEASRVLVDFGPQKHVWVGREKHHDTNKKTYQSQLPLTPALAMTGSATQGITLPNKVLVDITDAPHMVKTEWLMTALTRASASRVMILTKDPGFIHTLRIPPNAILFNQMYNINT